MLKRPILDKTAMPVSMLGCALAAYIAHKLMLQENARVAVSLVAPWMVLQNLIVLRAKTLSWKALSFACASILGVTIAAVFATLSGAG